MDVDVAQQPCQQCDKLGCLRGGSVVQLFLHLACARPGVQGSARQLTVSKAGKGRQTQTRQTRMAGTQAVRQRMARQAGRSVCSGRALYCAGFFIACEVADVMCLVGHGRVNIWQCALI